MSRNQILQIFTVRVAALVVRLPDRRINTKCLEHFFISHLKSLINRHLHLDIRLQKNWFVSKLKKPLL